MHARACVRVCLGMCVCVCVCEVKLALGATSFCLPQHSLPHEELEPFPPASAPGPCESPACALGTLACPARSMGPQGTGSCALTSLVPHGPVRVACLAARGAAAPSPGWSWHAAPPETGCGGELQRRQQLQENRGPSRLCGWRELRAGREARGLLPGGGACAGWGWGGGRAAGVQGASGEQ